jgi:hypothetical protein
MPVAAFAFLILATLSFFGTIIFLRIAQKMTGIYLKIGVIRRKDADTMSYIASYIVPFAATSFDKAEQVIALSIFLLVLCAVYVNSAMIHINPVLSMMQYNLYEFEDDDGNSAFLLSKQKIRRGSAVKAINLADGIFLEKLR